MHSAKEKIILFHPQTAFSSTGCIVPLHLLAVSRHIDRERFDVRIVNGEMKYDYRSILREQCKDALCIGIGFMTGYQIKQALEASQIAREVNPRIRIVWGGWHPSVSMEQTLQHPLADILVIGQGDVVFSELVNAISEGKDISSIKGLAFRSNGRITVTGDNRLEDLKQFSPLPFNLLPLNDYIRATRMGLRNIHYYSSQGCPYRCAFCADSLVNKRRWVSISNEQFIEDLKFLKKEYNIDSTTVIDSNFFVDMKRIRGLADHLVSENLGITFGGLNGRASQLKKIENSEWKHFAKAGLKELFVGVESALQEQLNFIKKDAKATDVLELADNLKGIDISLTFSLIMGLPRPSDKIIDISGELERELKSALSLTRTIFKANSGATAWFFLYTPYPGTPLFERSVENGFKKPGSLEEWVGMDLGNINSPWISKKFADKVSFFTEFIFYYMMNERLSNFLKSRASIAKKIFYIVLNALARIRWETGFFSFRFENSLVRFLRKLSGGGEIS